MTTQVPLKKVLFPFKNVTNSFSLDYRSSLATFLNEKREKISGSPRRFEVKLQYS